MKQSINQHIIELLQSANSKDHDKAMSMLYQKLYTKVSAYVLRNSGKSHEVADIFQDGLIILYKAVKQMKIPPDTNVQGYLFSICRNLWLKKLKKNARTQSLTKEYEEIPNEISQLDVLLSAEKKQLLESLLNGLGESCQKLLVHFYYDRLKIKKITELMNISSEQVTKNKKSACMKKLRSVIESRPELIDLLK